MFLIRNILMVVGAIAVLLSLLSISVASSGQVDPTLLQWEPGQEHYRLNGSYVQDLRWNPNHSKVAVATHDSHLYILDPLDYPESLTVDLVDYVTAVAWSADGDWLAVANRGHDIVILDTDDWSVERTLEYTDNVFTMTLDWSPDGGTLASGHFDTLDLWNTTTWERDLHLQDGVFGNISSVSWHPGGGIVALTNLNYVKIVSAPSGDLVTYLGSRRTTSYNNVAWSPDGSMVSVSSFDHNTYIYRTSDWRMVWTLKGHEAGAIASSWAQDLPLLATGGRDGTTRVWETINWTQVDVLGADAWAVGEVRWGSDPSVLVTGDVDMNVRLWRVPLANITLLGTRPPTTGDPLNVSCNVSSLGGIEEVYLSFRIADGTWETVEMHNAPPAEAYYAVLTTPHRLGNLQTRASTVDGFGRHVTSSTMSLAVVDNDPPTLVAELSDDVPKAGRNHTFRIEAVDNIGMGEVLVNYSVDGLATVIGSMEATSGEVYEFTTTMPNVLGEVRYHFLARDTSGNDLTTQEFAREIVDLDPPVVQDCTFNRTGTGNDHRFSADVWDNVEVGRAWMLLTVAGAHQEVEMEVVGGGRAFAPMKAPDTDCIMVYQLFVEDTSGNSNSTGEREVEVYDDDPPILLEDLTPAEVGTGCKLAVVLRIGDNIEVSIAELMVEIDGNEAVARTLEHRDGLYEDTVTVPVDARALVYRITARDPSGNVLRTEGREVIVVDVMTPTICGSADTDVPTGSGFLLSFNASDNLGDLVMTFHVRRAGSSRWTQVASRGHRSIETELSDEDLGIATIGTVASFSFYAVVTDSAGNRAEHGNSSEPYTLTITDGEAPVPSFDCPRTLFHDEPLVLDASLSSDNVCITSYIWRIEGPVTMDLEGERVETVLSKDGRYQVVLTVVDGSGNTGESSKELVVVERGSFDAFRTGSYLLLLVIAVFLCVVAYRMYVRRASRMS